MRTDDILELPPLKPVRCKGCAARDRMLRSFAEWIDRLDKKASVILRRTGDKEIKAEARWTRQ